MAKENEKLLTNAELVSKARTLARATHGRVSKRPWDDLRIWKNDPEWEAAVDQMPKIKASIPKSQVAEFNKIYKEMTTPPKRAKITDAEREKARTRYEKKNF